MKRALIFSTTYFPLVGGAEVAMKEVTDRMKDWEFDLICARIQPGLAHTEQMGKITVHRVGFGIPFDKYLLPILGPIQALFIPARKSGVVWSLMASYGGFAALVYCTMRGQSKMLLTLQEGDPLEHYAKRVGKLAFLHKRIFERADAVQAISGFLAQWAVKMGYTRVPDIVPNGVDIERFTKRITPETRRSMRTALGYGETDVVIVTASRLSLKNGIDDLIRSLTTLPEQYKVLIIGEGEDREKLHSLVSQKGLQARVQFLGKKGHDELPQLLQTSDIFCRASLSEGLGNSFLEAMAAGLPIIGTPVGGIPDFLTDGETGVFCQPNDPVSIGIAAKRIQEEHGLREKLIQQGEALVREHFNWDGISQRIEGMLDRLSV